MNRVRSIAGREQPAAVNLSIKARPVDEDPYALAIARQLARWFDAAGIQTSTTPMTAEALYRDALLNFEFDVVVGRFPYADVRPDSLYSFLHSRFAAEPGWQNPFGYANLAVDDLLTSQRRTARDDRMKKMAEIQRQIAVEAPFLVLGFPEAIRAARSDRFTGWDRAFDAAPLSLLSLDRGDFTVKTLRLTTTDPRPTTNLNPLVAPFRQAGPITNLLYDSLGRRLSGGVQPWLAESWTWSDEAPRSLTVTLRDDLTWHDGEAVTATDVASTYALLRDTSLGGFEQPVPPSRYRGRSTLVTDATVLDDRSVELSFTESTRPVARRALTVPILPAHIWRERTGQADVGGLDLGVPTTEALVTSNLPAVGSGPLKFESAVQRSSLKLSAFQDHFLRTSPPESVPGDLGGDIPFESFVLRFVGSDATALQQVAAGDADATAVGMGPDLIRRIGEEAALSLVLDREAAFYFVGFNHRRAPLGNPRFRRLLAQLVDREYLTRAVFEHHADPALSPLAGTEWVPEDLSWEGGDTVTPFLGTAGTVDVQRARAAVRAAGFRYNQQGRVRQA